MEISIDRKDFKIGKRNVWVEKIQWLKCKNLLEEFKSRFGVTKEKKSVDLMIGKLKLLDLRNRRKKQMSLRDKCNTIEEMKIGIIGFPEGRENAKEETIWRGNGWKLPKFDERHEFTSKRINKLQVRWI